MSSSPITFSDTSIELQENANKLEQKSSCMGRCWVVMKDLCNKINVFCSAFFENIRIWWNNLIAELTVEKQSNGMKKDTFPDLLRKFSEWKTSKSEEECVTCLKKEIDSRKEDKKFSKFIMVTEGRIRTYEILRERSLAYEKELSENSGTISAEDKERLEKDIRLCKGYMNLLFRLIDMYL